MGFRNPFAGIVIALLLSALAQAGDAVREDRFVRLGGIDQWITIRSADRTAPVLLWIHGGPAEIQSPLESVYEPWAREYTLVQWDQRGAGRTYVQNPGPADAVTLDRIANDGIELVELLRAQFGVSKIIIAGHSWGSLVAITMARSRPELFELVVGSGQVSSWRDTVAWQHAHALRKAQEAGDEAVVKELQTAGVPPHTDLMKYSMMRRRLAPYFVKVDSDWLQRQQALYASAPGVTPEILKGFAAAGSFSLPKLMSSVMSTDLRASVPTLDARLCVVQGSEDAFTPTDLARGFFDQVQTPAKQFHVIEGAGHFAAMTHSKEFLTALAVCRRT